MKKIQLYSVFVVAVISLYCSAAVAQQSNLSLDIRLTQDRYVVGETMKLVATLSNASNRTLPIVEVSALGTNMEYMYFVVTRPDGVVQHRTTKHLSYIGLIFGQNYKGEPLKSGDSVRVLLYPAASKVVHQDPEHNWDVGSMAFPEPGRYKLQLVYDIPNKFPQLVAATGKRTYSNELTVTVEAPTPEEAEILTACWKLSGRWFYTGDYDREAPHEDVALRRAIEKYPKNDMVRYAQFYLARSLMSSKTREYEQAIDYFKHLGDRYPSFRSEERLLLMGRCFAYLGRESEAQDKFAEALVIDPLLITNHDFMWGRWTSLYGSQGMKAVNKWRANRLAGAEHPERVTIEQ